MEFPFEHRAYGPDSTPEEIAAIRSRVKHVRDNIIAIHDVPVGSTFSIGILIEEMQRIAEGWSVIKVFVDVADARRPTPEYREALLRFGADEPRLIACAVYIGKSRVFATIARVSLALLGASAGMRAFHSREAAMRYLDDVDER